MRCPDCNKFVAYDDSGEPETNLDIIDGHATGDVRVVLTCAECGTELKESTFEIDVKVELPKHTCHIPAIEGCPEHVEGTPCPICKWDGKKMVGKHYLKVERYAKPRPTLMAGGKETRTFIGEIRQSYGGITYYEDNEYERAKFEKAAAEAERELSGIPVRKPFVPVREESDSFEVDVESCELTTRSDCGVNKRTGKPNKFNARYATTYYGFDLTATVTCECGEIKHEITVSDDIAASSMDEMV